MGLFSNTKIESGNFEQTYTRPQPLPVDSVVKAAISQWKVINYQDKTTGEDKQILKAQWDFEHEGSTRKVFQDLFIHNGKGDLEFFGAILVATGYTPAMLQALPDMLTESDLEKSTMKAVLIKLGQKTIKTGYDKETGRYNLPQEEWYKENTVKGVQAPDGGAQEVIEDLPF